MLAQKEFEDDGDEDEKQENSLAFTEAVDDFELGIGSEPFESESDERIEKQEIRCQKSDFSFFLLFLEKEVKKLNGKERCPFQKHRKEIGIDSQRLVDLGIDVREMEVMKQVYEVLRKFGEWNTVELLIEEISESAKKNSQRNENQNQVKEHQKVASCAFFPPKEDSKAGDYSENSSDEGHSAFSDLEDFAEMLEIVAFSVNQDMTESSSDDNSECDAENHIFQSFIEEIVNFGSFGEELGFADSCESEIAEQKRKCVKNPISINAESKDTKGNHYFGRKKKSKKSGFFVKVVMLCLTVSLRT